jgi:hypothetical protein
MERPPTRLGTVASYYRRVLAGAMHEATHPWQTKFGTSAALALIAFGVSWPLTGSSALTALVVGFATLGGWWLVVFAWLCFTIPPRLENEVQMARRDLMVWQERVGTINAIRAIANDCRTAAQWGRGEVLRVKDTDVPVDVDAIHAQALHQVKRVEEMLKNYGTQPGQRPYTEEMTEISSAVDGSRPADAEAAIAQLLALAAVLDQHIYAGRYGM